jgi:F-type H+-transporting ATPase subunit alpha
VNERRKQPDADIDHTSVRASARASVASLLRALRQQADQLNDQVRFRDTDPGQGHARRGDVRKNIERLSQSVASLPALQRTQPDTASLLQTLRQQADQLSGQVRFHDVGTVQHIGDGVATLSGLPHARTDALLTFPTGVQGLILNLDHERIDVILLGPDEGIQGGDLVTATGERLRTPVGHNLLGRVVNPLGKPLDRRGPVEATESHYLERDAPGIVDRTSVNMPLQTGLKIVDALVPIGRGQRELIVGDRQTGKTTLAVDAILNQRDGDTPCVYVAIGQKKSSTLAVIETLRRHDALPYTVVVVSSPDDPPALRYLAPYAGCTMAEFLMHQGRDVLIVYDDLSKHADAYRELSLLLRRPPGREAYPGDIFYLHARLLERACKLSDAAGGGSLTALPIVEMQRGNLAAYIPTNLISISDGQIVLDADLFNRGVKPAVDVGRSVSRVGGAAQTAAMRDVARHLRLDLAQFEEVARFARFGAEIDEATQHQIQRGERLRAVLTQPAHRPLSLAAQVVILLAATGGYLDDVAAEDVPAIESEVLTRIEAQHTEFFNQLNRSGELTPEMRDAMIDTMAQTRTVRLEGHPPGPAEGREQE